MVVKSPFKFDPKVSYSFKQNQTDYGKYFGSEYEAAVKRYTKWEGVHKFAHVRCGPPISGKCNLTMFVFYLLHALFWG